MDKKSAKLRTVDLVYIALMATLMAVCSWISIPATVEFTMQTFAVFAALGLLGGKRALIAVCVYLLMGAIGLPVFAGFNGGLSALLGSTGGYLVGFLAMALVYWLMTSLLGDSRWVRVGAMVLALLVCYAFGTAWFVVVYTRQAEAIGWMTALGWCVFPFIIPDLLKLALAMVLTDRLAKRLQ
ncbi:MAG: biotin transporter BioY [Clostridia bacterium]|nr:biotin transporter BioY [Clostridia bacterium]